MADYGRVPKIEVETPQTEEKKIFNTQSAEKTETKPQTEDKKKIALREHLARCREKSIAVRKAKAEERKKNKKPRGRPKKENIKLETQTLDDGTKLRFPATNEELNRKGKVPEEEKQVFKEPEVNKDQIQNDVMEKEQPKTHAMFDMEQLLNKLDERIDKRFESMKPPAPSQPTMPYFNPHSIYDEFSKREKQIREDERNRILNEAKKQKEEQLRRDTNNYFRKMPRANFVQSDNQWDNLLNPKKYSN